MNVINNGTTACVLDGYPGVNLIGVAHGQSRYTWTLQWATVSHSPVTLEPGASAHFDVVYAEAAEGGMGTPSVGATATATASASPVKSAVASKTTTPAKPAVSGKATAPAKGAAASGKASVAATVSQSAAAKSVPESIEVLDITITLPNTYTQDQMAWYAEIVLQDKVAHAQTYVTPFVAGAA
jgi:hypothetical protein